MAFPKALVSAKSEHPVSKGAPSTSTESAAAMAGMRLDIRVGTARLSVGIGSIEIWSVAVGGRGRRIEIADTRTH